MIVARGATGPARPRTRWPWIGLRRPVRVTSWRMVPRSLLLGAALAGCSTMTREARRDGTGRLLLHVRRLPHELHARELREGGGVPGLDLHLAPGRVHRQRHLSGARREAVGALIGCSDVRYAARSSRPRSHRRDRLPRRHAARRARRRRRQGGAAHGRSGAAATAVLGRRRGSRVLARSGSRSTGPSAA